MATSGALAAACLMPAAKVCLLLERAGSSFAYSSLYAAPTGARPPTPKTTKTAATNTPTVFDLMMRLLSEERTWRPRSEAPASVPHTPGGDPPVVGSLSDGRMPLGMDKTIKRYSL